MGNHATHTPLHCVILSFFFIFGCERGCGNTLPFLYIDLYRNKNFTGRVFTSSLLVVFYIPVSICLWRYGVMVSQQIANLSYLTGSLGSSPGGAVRLLKSNHMLHYPNGKELVLKTSDGRKSTAGSSPVCSAKYEKDVRSISYMW